MTTTTQLSPGTMLGPYRVESLLGAGGMGQVYRAVDTRLDRAVAIKTSPERFSGRFEQEARAISALNHPHICTLFDVGPNYLVMELVEGETLAARLRKRKLTVEEVVRCGAEIADALAAAHGKGITHRDLKPANVMVTKGGAKVLDFGLAKTNNLDETVTAANVVMGTPAYMAPEQSEGRTCDARSDIYSLGLILYEACAGKRLHPGASIDGLPPRLAHVLARCLEHDPEKRWQSARDVKTELEWAGTNETDVPVRAGSPRWLWAVAGVLCAALIALGLRNLKPVPAVPQPVSRFTIDIPSSQLPIDAGLPVPIAVAPDGGSFFYVSHSGGEVYRLHRRKRDELQGSAIPGTEGALMPFVSPDGQWIGFVSGGMLKKVPLAGGPPVTICPVAMTPGGASWGSDNTIVFAPSWDGGLVSVSADGGTPRTLIALNAANGEISQREPHVLPDGRVLFTLLSRGSARIEVFSPQTGDRRVLVEGTSAAYLASGLLVFARTGTLFAVPVDLSKLRLSKQAIPVLQGVRSDSKTYFAAARDGTLAYVPASAVRSKLVWVDRKGKTSSILGDPRPFSHPRLSPDGTKLVLANAGIWVHELKTGAGAQLAASGSRPIWTADGKHIVFASGVPKPALYSVPADGSSEPQLVLPQQALAVGIFPLAWSADGRFLAFSNPTGATSRDVWVMPRDGKPTPFLNTVLDERAAMFSPDGRWLVYAVKDTGGEEEVYVQPYPGPGGRFLISAGGGSEPVWSRDGKEIFYRSLDGSKMMEVTVQMRSSFSASAPKLLFQGSYAPSNGNYYSNYDFLPDGQRFLMLEREKAASDTQVNVVLNWPEELKRRLPVQ